MLGDYPKHVFDLLQQQLASTGRIGFTRSFLTPDIATPAAAGGISAPAPIRFNVNGIALALYGQERDTATAVAYAQCAVRVQIGGTEDLFVDGNGGPAFAPMLALFGGVNNWIPLLRQVREGDQWTFSFRNDTAAGTIDPTCMVTCIADKDLANVLAQINAAQQGRRA